MVRVAFVCILSCLSAGVAVKRLISRFTERQRVTLPAREIPARLAEAPMR